MDTRLFAYIALIFLGLLIYDAWVEDYRPKPAPPAKVSTEPQTSQQDIPQFSPESQMSPGGQTDVPAPDPTSESAASSQPAKQTIKVETDVLSLEIDLQGGTVVRAELPGYPVDIQHPDQPVRLLAVNDRFYVAQSGLLASKEAR
ncbi:MAG TPA: membrane protein insertase YidC, partial [Gammaproteobacteria bacterium]